MIMHLMLFDRITATAWTFRQSLWPELLGCPIRLTLATRRSRWLTWRPTSTRPTWARLRCLGGSSCWLSSEACCYSASSCIASTRWGLRMLTQIKTKVEILLLFSSVGSSRGQGLTTAQKLSLWTTTVTKTTTAAPQNIIMPPSKVLVSIQSDDIACNLFFKKTSFYLPVINVQLLKDKKPEYQKKDEVLPSRIK